MVVHCANDGSESLNDESQSWERSPQSGLVVLPCFIMWIAVIHVQQSVKSVTEMAKHMSKE